MINSIKKELFGKSINGQQVYLYTLTNKNGMTVKVTNYGANIVSIVVPDKKGNFEDVALGYDTLEQYQNDQCFLGALVGRYAGRIGGAKFDLDGTRYNLVKNHGEHQLHGGPASFNHKIWQGTVDQEKNSIQLIVVSADGEQGYPGELTVAVTYTLTDNNELVMQYQANTTKPTVVNLTQHVYLNLAGHTAGDVSDHLIQINADKVIVCDADIIPTGDINIVDNSAFDLRKLAAISAGIDSTEQQMKIAGGYDHYWFFEKNISLNDVAAVAIDPESGRQLRVYTDQPGMVFYTGNNFEGVTLGKEGHGYMYRSGFCLETQYPADAPNHDHFPSTRLAPEETYKAITRFAFGVEA